MVHYHTKSVFYLLKENFASPVAVSIRWSPCLENTGIFLKIVSHYVALAGLKVREHARCKSMYTELNTSLFSGQEFIMYPGPSQGHSILPNDGSLEHTIMPGWKLFTYPTITDYIFPCRFWNRTNSLCHKDTFLLKHLTVLATPTFKVTLQHPRSHTSNYFLDNSCINRFSKIKYSNLNQLLRKPRKRSPF